MASLLDHFDRAYVINLPERADRRRAIARELEGAGMPLQPGRVEIFPGIRPDSSAPFTSRGERGCFLSHLELLKRARAENLESVLVLEDDVIFSPRLKNEMDGILRQLHEEKWDSVYFGHSETVGETGRVKLVRHAGPRTGTFFYGLKRDLIPRLIGFLEEVMTRPKGHPDGGPMHVDGAYWFYRDRHPEVVTLLAAPSLVVVKSSRSDVGPKWFDGLPGLRQAASAARRVKAFLQRRSLQKFPP